jgi:thiol-disulfide isomerase/thioredoxin
MSRSRLGMRVLALTVALTALTATSARAQDSGLEIGTMAPAVDVQTLAGATVNLGKYIGKTPIIMEFWATWCPVCKELEPTLLALTKKYPKVQFIGIAVSVNQSPELVKRFVEAHKLPGEHFFDKKGLASGAYDAAATSYVLVIDKSGKVVYTGVGGKQPKLEEAIKKVAGP